MMFLRLAHKRSWTATLTSARVGREANAGATTDRTTQDAETTEVGCATTDADLICEQPHSVFPTTIHFR